MDTEAKLRAALQSIANIRGNLSDEVIQRVGGVNDARSLALSVVHARQIAREALESTADTPSVFAQLA
jgi:hypothetical protein